MRIKRVELHVYSHEAALFYKKLGILVRREGEPDGPATKGDTLIFRQIDSIPCPRVLPPLVIECGDLQYTVWQITQSTGCRANEVDLIDPDGRSVTLVQAR